MVRTDQDAATGAYKVKVDDVSLQYQLKQLTTAKGLQLAAEQTLSFNQGTDGKWSQTAAKPFVNLAEPEDKPTPDPTDDPSTKPSDEPTSQPTAPVLTPPLIPSQVTTVELLRNRQLAKTAELSRHLPVLI